MDVPTLTETTTQPTLDKTKREAAKEMLRAWMTSESSYDENNLARRAREHGEISSFLARQT
jgi:hypothetical protein